jgi:hypothetical protein
MSVIIEQLDAEVMPPTIERQSEQQAPVKVPDERKMLEALVYQQWQQARLIAD